MAWGGASPEGGCGRDTACWGGGDGESSAEGPQEPSTGGSGHLGCRDPLATHHRSLPGSLGTAPSGSKKGSQTPPPGKLPSSGHLGRRRTGQPRGSLLALGSRRPEATVTLPVSGGSTWPTSLGSDTPHLTMSLMGSSGHWVGQQTGPKVLWGQEGVHGVLTPSQLDPVLGLGCGESWPLTAGLGSPAQGCGAGDSLLPALPLLALRFQPRRGLGLACAGPGVSRPRSFWLLRSAPRAGRRSPCVRDGNGYRSAPWPGLLVASLVSATGVSRVVFGGTWRGSWEGGHAAGRPGASRRVEAG